MKQSIFISYSRDDEEFAIKLAMDLKNRNITVWLDEWEIKVGDLLVTKIGDAIKKTTYFGIILSPSSVKKPWVQTELNSALIKELNLNKVTVLPILRENCEIPTLLWGKKYADFRGNYDKGLNELLRVFRPTIQLLNLPFNSIVEKKEHLKYVPSCITLVNGTVLVGVVAGISKSRESLGIDPLHSSPFNSHFHPMHPNQIKYWVDVDSALIADMWALEFPLNEEFETISEQEARNEKFYEKWLNEPGWVPWHFFDETCNRLKCIAGKEHITTLVPVRDLAAIGPRCYRYGNININSYMPIYCDWWYLDMVRKKYPEKHFKLSYKESMDLFFKSESKDNLVMFKCIVKNFGLKDEEILELEDDEWVLINVERYDTKASNKTSEIVLFRWRSLFFSLASISKIRTSFNIIGEVVNEPLSIKKIKSDHYLKARGAFYLNVEAKNGCK